MKVIRTINIEADLWAEAKKLPSISAVLNKLLADYINYNKNEMKKKELLQEINNIENKINELNSQKAVLKSYLEKKQEEEQIEKKKKIEEIKIKKESKSREEFIESKPLSINEIQYFHTQEPSLNTYNGMFGTDYNEEELEVRFKKFKEK